jgi:hypothetical protein
MKVFNLLEKQKIIFEPSDRYFFPISTVIPIFCFIYRVMISNLIITKIMNSQINYGMNRFF